MTDHESAIEGFEEMQQIYAESARRVVISMLSAVQEGMKEGWDFKTLAENRISDDLQQKIEQLDIESQKAFMFLFRAVSEHIRSDEEILQVVISQIQLQKDKNAAVGYLNSFVLEQIPILIENIRGKSNPSEEAPE